MKLYNWHSSSTSFRVRIALAVKGCSYEHVPVELDWEDGDHDRPEYRELNPQANVPVLVEGDARIMQSLAIIEYLEETRPHPPLFPQSPGERAHVRSLALYVACEIQPLNNLRTQRRLAAQFEAPQSALSRWQKYWCEIGFDALEMQLASSRATGRFCHGDRLGVADCFLVPQVYNSRRPVVGADLSRWPTIRRIYEACLETPQVQQALPKNQPGFVEPEGH